MELLFKYADNAILRTCIMILYYGHRESVARTDVILRHHPNGSHPESLYKGSRPHRLHDAHHVPRFPDDVGTDRRGVRGDRLLDSAISFSFRALPFLLNIRIDRRFAHVTTTSSTRVYHAVPSFQPCSGDHSGYTQVIFV